jgi:hypothetical protein
MPFANYLYYVANNGTMLDAGQIALTMAASLLIPSMIALFLALRNANEGFAVVGTADAFVGIIVYLANVTSFSYFVDRAYLYSQCTSCIQTAYAEALGSQSFYFGPIFALILIFLAILILVWL